MLNPVCIDYNSFALLPLFGINCQISFEGPSEMNKKKRLALHIVIYIPREGLMRNYSGRVD